MVVGRGALLIQVLTIIDSLAVGGAEQSLAMLTPHLVQRGVEVHIAYLTERPGLHDELRSAGAVLHSLAGSGGRLGSLARTTRLLRLVRPDLVHTTLFESDIVGRVAARLLGVPVVSSFVTESYGPEHVGNPEYRRWRVLGARLADAVTARFVTRFHAVSVASAEIMARRLWIPRDRVDVIPRGRDPVRLGGRSAERRSRVRLELHLADDTPLLLAAARHFHMKGLDVLIEAYPKVVSSFPEATLIIAGREGPASRELRRLIEAGGVESATRLLGYRSDVSDLMSAADVFVLPSRAEGSPGVLIEAMALETPAVASDIPSARELAGGSGGAIALAAVDSADDLARAIISLLEEPERAAAMAAEGRRRFLDHYSIDGIADAMVDLYHRCLVQG